MRKLFKGFGGKHSQSAQDFTQFRSVDDHDISQRFDDVYESIADTDVVAVSCKLMSNSFRNEDVTIRQIKDHVSEPEDNDVTLPTVPKTTERLGNAPSLSDVLANIDEHKGKLVNGYTCDKEIESSRADANNAVSLIHDIKLDNHIATDSHRTSRMHLNQEPDDDTFALNPDAVIELFTHQGDAEAFEVEHMLQTVIRSTNGQFNQNNFYCEVSNTLENFTEGLKSVKSKEKLMKHEERIVMDCSGRKASFRGDQNNIDLKKSSHRILKLTYHTDIWDNAVWSDGFASKKHTDRQRNYAKRLKIKHLYTPQIIVSGRIALGGSDERKTLHAIETCTKFHSLGEEQGAYVWMQLDNTNETKRRITAFVMTRGSLFPHDRNNAHKMPDVFLVIYDRKLGTRIGGINKEKRGHILDEENVVRQYSRLHVWLGRPLEFSFLLPDQHDGCALLIQAPSYGPILACSFLEPGRGPTNISRQTSTKQY